MGVSVFSYQLSALSLMNQVEFMVLPTDSFEGPSEMSKAHKKKKSPKARRPKGAARGSRPTARVNPGIAAAARDNVASIVGQGRVPERALEIPLSAFFLADHLTRRFEAEAELPHPVACQDGCDSCCYNQVELTPPEALLIGHHIAQQFSEAEKDLLLAHVARIIEIIKAMGPAESAARRREIPCPLLRNRTCSVYPARPLVCRAMHGLDRERCVRGTAHRQPGGKSILRPPPRNRGVGERRAAGRAVRPRAYNPGRLT